ncbi:MAG: AraC-like DNA-binding protein, partial [Bermanella sp.]
DSRCRLAKRYLVDGQFTSLEIAFLLGYSEQSAFIRAFKEWMGITPGEYLLLVK